LVTLIRLLLTGYLSKTVRASRTVVELVRLGILPSGADLFDALKRREQEIAGLSRKCDPLQVRTCADMGIAPEALIAAANGKDFRGFVIPLHRPGQKVILHQGPLARFVRAGTALRFKIEAREGSEAAIFNGTAPVKLHKAGALFQGGIIAQPGLLQIGVKFPTTAAKHYDHVLRYVVESGKEKELLNVNGALTESDPPDGQGFRRKIHSVDLAARKTCFIMVEAPADKPFPSKVLLEDDSATIAEDIRGGWPDSLLVCTPEHGGTYRIVVTSDQPNTRGDYRLIVRQ
jgi:hypothetical protein